MRDAISSIRRTAAVSLITAAVLSAVSVVLQPNLSGDAGGRLAAIHAAGPRADVSAVAFVVSQLPFIFGVIGIGSLVRDRAPRLAGIGTVLGVIGGFGHAVFGGVSMAELLMAADTSHGAALAGFDETLQSSPVMMFALAGLAGTVLGLLLLSIGLFRTRVVPVWVPVLLWAFLLLEFAGGGISSYASDLAAVLLLVACVALARTLRCTATEARVAVPSVGSEADAVA